MPRMPILGCLVLTLMVALAAVRLLIAMTPAVAPANVVTRVYDVRELALNLADPQQGGLSREEAVNRIIRRVQTIAPFSWKDFGGQVGSVRELSGQLIVTHTPAIQKRVAELLTDECRARGLEFQNDRPLKSSQVSSGHVDFAVSCSFSAKTPATAAK